MKRQYKKTRPWHPVESSIIKNVSRYGVMTATALCVWGAKGVKDSQQAGDRLSALARRGDLVRHKVSSVEECYSLAPAAAQKAKALGFNSPSCLHSIESLTHAYALMSVCLLQNEKRKLLTNAELTQNFPELGSHGGPSRYYLAREAEQTRLGFVRIDQGGRGRWDRIARKANDDMRKHLSLRCLLPMIDQRQFEICIVTALPGKAQRIEEVLRANQELLNVPYRVISIPDLINFIRPRPD